MATFFRDYGPDDVHLLPPDPREWLPADHLAYQVHDALGQMNMTALRLSKLETRGAPGFDPFMMATLTLYGMCRGALSSRKIAALCVEDIGGRYLSSGATPSYRSFVSFRSTHKDALSRLFAETVDLCERAGLVDVVDLFGDGTKVKANASLGKSVRYDRVDAKRAHMDELFNEIALNDAQEDEEYGPDNDAPGRGRSAEQERAVMQDRTARLAEGKRQIEEEAKADLAEHLAKPKDKRTHHMAPTGQPNGEKKVNMTDPCSRVMRGPKGVWMQAYNAQIVAESSNLIIVGATLSNDPLDYKQLLPSIESVKETTGKLPSRMVADSGYFSDSNVTDAAKLGVATLMPPKRQDRCGPYVPQPPVPDEVLEKMTSKDKMNAILATQEGHDAYAKRQYTVETVFAMIKGCPGHPGLRQFLRRGIEKCRDDWLLTCAVHNLKRYIAARMRKPDTTTRELRHTEKQFTQMEMELSF